MAACLYKRAMGSLDIAIVELGRFHYYQPAFTLVRPGSLSCRHAPAGGVAGAAGVKLIRGGTRSEAFQQAEHGCAWRTAIA